MDRRPLADILRGHAYPLHFIDFETSRLAVPYHAGMRPYEQVGFQWSCHTLREPGGEIEHGEWINLDDAFPNFAFARSLMQTIGDAGTVFTWSHHAHPLFKKYYAEQHGVILSPYDTLQPLPFGDDSDEGEEVVKEGTGAMRAYQEMLYGVSKNDPGSKGKWKQLLLQYCELDTAAMIIIWWHWCWKCGIF